MPNQTERPATPPARDGLSRLTLSAAVLIGAALLLIVTFACNSSKDDATPDPRMGGNGVSNVTVATFTPVPPGYTPSVNATIPALRTQVTLGKTATAQALASATAPPSDGSPAPSTGSQGEIVFPTPPATGENLIYPPTSVLQVGDRYVGATIGSYNWADPKLGRGGGDTAPWIQMTEESLIVVPGETATLRFADGAPTPVETTIEVYAYDGNVAIPTLPNGQPFDEPAFVRQTDPVASSTVQGADPSFTIDQPAADYIVVANVTWPDVTGAESRGKQFTQYAYRITVK